MVSHYVANSHLRSHGLRGFTVSKCELEEKDVYKFFTKREQQLKKRNPDSPLLQTLTAAIPRFAILDSSETLWRWEASSPIGQIVGYTTKRGVLAVFPWIYKDNDWVASIIKF